MLQSIQIPLAIGKAIVEWLEASRRPEIESTVIVEIAKVMMRSMMFRGPEYPVARQLIAVELLLGVPSDVIDKVTANPEALVATPTKKPDGREKEQGILTESLSAQKVELWWGRGLV